MNKFYIFITFLVSFSLSDKDYYLPMEKDSKYGDDVCCYYNFDDTHYYVKPCEKGKYCVSNSISTSRLEICQDIPNIVHPLNLDEKCSSTFECGYGLKCISGSCTLDCSSGQFLIQTSPTTYRCVSDTLKSSSDDYCMKLTYDSSGNPNLKYSSPVKNKICGKLTISERTDTGNSGIYYISLKEHAFFGSVKDGEYVDDMKLCESGYALYFYYDGQYNDPKPLSSSSPFTNQRYLRCITPISISDVRTGTYTITSSTSSTYSTTIPICTIHYNLQDKEYIYNLGRLSDGNLIKELSDEFCNEKYINIKSDRYREFFKNITTEEDRNTCGDLEDINKYTCENRELIKSWYFYKNPDSYILYNGREKLEKVLDYLIQKSYPTYYSFGRFLNLSLLLFIILFLF